MNNVIKVAFPAVKTGAKYVVKNWPNLARAFSLLSTFLKEHPEVPGWFRARVEDVQKQIERQLIKRDPHARIVGVLQVVREEALADGMIDGATWIARADGIERDLRLAELQVGTARKISLNRLEEESTDLVSALLLASARARAEPREDEPLSD